MSFHLFHIAEVYSNADGTVQFIEFVGDANGQHLWAGHQIIATGGGAQRVFNVPANLPSSTTNDKSVLVATQGYADYAALNGLPAPDFFIPNGFLFAGTGSVSFPGMDSLSWTSLPTDGTSVNGSGVIGANSPANFLGATGSIPLPVNEPGTPGDDSLVGTPGNDTLSGAGGNDTLDGGGDNDRLDGGSGLDSINGGTGADLIIISDEAHHAPGETINGGGGDDVIRFTSTIPGQGLELTAGVTQIERVEISDADGVTTGTTPLDVDASAVTSGGLRITGNNGVNSITGTNFQDVIVGNAGNDNLLGGGGPDIFLVGLGDHHGADETINGGADFNVIRFTSTTPNDTLELSSNVSNISQVRISDAAGAITGTTSLNVDASGVGSGLDLIGNNGANALTGNASFNVLIGGAGSDTLLGGGSNDNFEIGAGDFTAEEVIDGGAGADGLIYTGTTGTLSLTANVTNVENLLIAHLTAPVNLDASNVDRTGIFVFSITGNDGANALTGTVGNDQFIGGGGADTLVGGAGDDLFLVFAGADLPATERINGGPGEDTLRFTGEAANVVLGAGVIALEVVQLFSTAQANASVNAAAVTTGLFISGHDVASTLTGTHQADIIDGNDGDDSLAGLGGNDTLDGGVGTDTLTGGAGADSQLGGDGDDIVLLGSAAELAGDTIDGGTGTDSLRFTSTVAATFVLTAGVTGFETALIRTAAGGVGTAAINVDASAVTSGGLILAGNDGANRLTGTDFDDTIQDAGGNDTFVGGLGNDTYNGGAGNDVILIADPVHLGATELIAGEAGTDVLRFTSTTAGQTLTLPAVLAVELVAISNEAGAITGTTALNVDAAATTHSIAITGNNGANTIVGTGAHDTLTGNGGDDSLVGGAGNDSISGGAGNDTLNGGAGLSTLAGGAGNDTYDQFLDGPANAAVISEALNAGIDTVRFAGASHTLAPNVENLLLLNGEAASGTGNTLNNVIVGSFGNDTLNGAAGNDTLIGDAGSDIFNGGAGADSVRGGEGNDIILVASVAEYAGDRIDGGDDIGDVLRFTSAVAATLTLNVNFTGVENVLAASASGDPTGTAAININASAVPGPGLRIVGNNGNNIITGTAGGDDIIGADGNDTLIGGAGVDTLFGGAGNDVFLIGSGAHHAATESIGDGPGVNVIRFTSTVADMLELSDQVTGIREVEASDAAGANTGTAALDINASEVLFDLVITGNAGHNMLTGTGNDDTITGNAGNDTIFGGQGEDSLLGGAGNDRITMLLGAGDVDFADGGAGGVDTLLLNGSEAGVVFVNLAATGDQVSFPADSGPGGLSQRNFENVDASGLAPNDGINITGSSGANIIVGTAGAFDTIAGGGGNDSLDGRGGGDILDGGDGNDTLVGGAGSDTMSGGTGNNLFLIAAEADYGVAEVITGGPGAADVIQFISPMDNEGLNLDASVTQIEQVVIGGTAELNVDASGVSTRLMIVGNNAANEIWGTGGNDIINANGGDDDITDDNGNDRVSGGAGNDTMHSGAGIDTLMGGAGDDTYVDVNPGPGVNRTIVSEAAGMGTDTVQTNFTYTLTANVENLELLGGAINGTGNTIGNLITGNAGHNVLNGLAGNDTLVASAGNDTLNGGAGSDTANFSADTGTLIVNLGATPVLVLGGEIGGGGIVTLIDIENFIGGLGNDSLTGSTVANLLDGGIGNDSLAGGAGNDTLTGGTGIDTLDGGAGNDLYHVDNSSDRTAETVAGAAGGTDTVISTASNFTLTIGNNIERLTLVGGVALAGTGNELANLITGNEFDNSLRGRDGNDTLVGGAGADTLDGGAGTGTPDGGADSMAGGAGDDYYEVGGAGDVVVEGLNAGNDTVVISNGFNNYTLHANVEIAGMINATAGTLRGNTLGNQLTLTATGSGLMDGGAGNDQLTSFGASADTLLGGAGNDTLVAGNGSDTVVGGAGADDLRGEAGNDVFLYAAPADFSAGEFVDGGDGFDFLRFTSVTAGQTLVLSGTVLVERVEITNAAGVVGATALNVNAADVTNGLEINGNNGANALTGTGVADTFNGLGGNDTYRITGGDLVNENPNGGLDTVIHQNMAANYTLPANVENLTILAWEAGVATGNDLNNAIRNNTAQGIFLLGLAGADSLIGGTQNDTLEGGLGTDTLQGGLGDDLYQFSIADGLGDRIVEAAGQGLDRVEIHGDGNVDVSFTLPANVENAELDNMGSRTGTLIGNTLGNLLVGNGEGGGFVLNGGLGNDTLVGDDGADTLLGGAGNDVIRLASVAHFVVGERIDGGTETDTLQLTGSGQTLDLTTIANDRILGIEIVDIAGSGNNTLQLALADVLDLSATSNTLRVDGGAGDIVRSADFWTLQGTVSSGGNVYNRYTSGAATLLVDSDVALVHDLPFASLNGANGFRVSGEDQFDSAGRASASAGDLNGDGFADVLVGASGYDAAYVVFGRASGFAADIAPSSLNGANGFVILPVQTYNATGASLDGAGDVNGDGLADIVIGGFAVNVEAGEAYVVFGGFASTGGEVDLANLDGTNGFSIDAEASGDRFAYSVSVAGDVNGDGLDDLIFGAPRADPGAVNRAGSAYVVFGSTALASTGGNLDLGGLDGATGFKLAGQHVDGYAGFSVSGAGDVNGDGFDDMLIGAIRPTGGLAGESYLVFGRADFSSVLDVEDTLQLASLDGSAGFRISAETANDQFGFSVADAGDVNGDGFADVIIGAKLAGGFAGASYVVFGRANFAPVLDSSTLDLSALDGTTGFALDGAAAQDFAGAAVSGAGDVNGDGYADILVGAFGVGVGPEGAGYVVYGRADFAPLLDNGRLGLSTMDAGTGFRLPGAVAGGQAGWSVSAAGDVNGDGFADVMVGAPYGDSGGLTDTGTSYVVFGGDFANAVTFQGTAASNALTGTAAAENFVAGLGNDTLTGGGGADVFHAGAGNDTIVAGPTGFRLIDGGAGTDTLRLAGAGVTLDLTTLANSRTAGIEIINITGTGNNTLTLNLRDLLDLSGSTNTLRVDGNAGDTVNSAGQGWVVGGAAVAGYTSYVSGTATLLIDNDITQTNVS